MRAKFTFLAIWLCLIAGPAYSAGTGQDARPADKTLITDGSIVHHAGQLRNNVTNWGLIGSRPSMPSPFSTAPSARWPGQDGTDFLWAAGFWIGGIRLGETLVSTGQYASEIMANADPVNIIYATAQGTPGGNRYPWPDADDDADGLEDEDPLDGRDNDGDGLVDEDYAAASDEEFRCVMWDTTALARQNYPDHVPLGLQVVQSSFQWSDPALADFIGYEYTATNIGVAAIDGVYCAMFSDFDVGSQANDDIMGGWTGLVHETVSDSFVPVSLAWVHDEAAVAPAPGYCAWVLCGIATDAAAGGPADPLQMYSLNFFSGQVSFELGGDPTNDAERYQLISTPNIDADPAPGRIADWRCVIGAPRVPSLAPGESVTFRAALVAGLTLADLLANAARAVLAAQGQNYDRDGDPANGAEFNVPWLPLQDAPVPAIGGRLVPNVLAGGVELAFDVFHADGLPVAVQRRSGRGLAARSWVLADAAGRVVDDDAGPWPRTYDLVAKAAAADLVLDTVEVSGPPAPALALAGSPNPFNPRVTLDFTLPAAGWARLTVHDARGRRVRELFAESRPAGAGRVPWDGTDDGGRGVASGVYTVRLETVQGVTEQRVTLLR